MSRAFDDDELRAIRAAFENEETPTELRQPRGHGRCAGRDIVSDAIVGETEAPDEETPDPPDFKLRRVPRDYWRGK